MSRHPYADLPASAFWRRAVAEADPAEVDPVVAAPFRIARGDRVATAGSCFAQHIARCLRDAGFGHLVTETPHPVVAEQDPERFGYGVFTARYGNVYTSRQLLQLFQRAHGAFTPCDDAWTEPDGRLTDPFRPAIQPGRFLSAAEYRADRQRHFACVREAFATLDVLVFTFGLTECWASREDGAVYPLCPGVSGGQFDPARHVFLNLTMTDVVADMTAFLGLLRSVNPRARVLLTVSPVPLVATFEPQHVLAATTYSKAVLRVAAETLARDVPGVAYFPSFEIITGGFSRGLYFAEDGRSVTEAGVAHVMRCFMRHFTEAGVASNAPAAATEDAHTRAMERLVRVACEEEALDSGRAAHAASAGQPG